MYSSGKKKQNKKTKTKTNKQKQTQNKKKKNKKQNKKKTIWLSRKTNETNSFKVNTQGKFDLAILKVIQINYKESKFLQLDLTLNILLPPIVNYSHDHVQTSNSQTPLLNLHHTSIHASDFDISLKGFKSWLVDLCSN